MGTRVRTAGALLAGLLLWGSIVTGPASRHESAAGLPRVEFIKTLAAGLHGLAADVFWLGAIQMEGRANSAEGYRVVSDWGEFATELDPKFLAVYHFVPVATTFNLGRERWVNTAESTSLLRKGLRHYPDDWTLNFQLAYNLMYFDRNYTEAGQIIQKLAIRGKVPTLSLLASRLLAQGDDFSKARAIAADLAENAPSDELREYYQRRVLQVDQEVVLKRVDQATQQFRRRTGKFPSDVAQLLASGDLAEVLQDPLGGTIAIDAEGRARASSEWYRLEMFDDKKKKKTAAAQGDMTTFAPH